MTAVPCPAQAAQFRHHQPAVFRRILQIALIAHHPDCVLQPRRQSLQTLRFLFIILQFNPFSFQKRIQTYNLFGADFPHPILPKTVSHFFGHRLAANLLKLGHLVPRTVNFIETKRIGLDTQIINFAQIGLFFGGKLPVFFG